MKITMIGPLPPVKGGISDYCIELLNALSEKIDIDFINFQSIYPKFLYPQNPFETGRDFQIKKHSGMNIRSLLKWYHPFGNFWVGIQIKTRIVHFHWWTSFLFIVFFPLLVAIKLTGCKKIICTTHNIVGHESGIIDRILTRMMMSLPDHFIAHSEASAKRLCTLNRISPNRVSIIQHGRYDLYHVENVSKGEAREFLKISENQKVILFFGYIREYKGIDTLIQAMKKVKEACPDVCCLIAGNNWISWEPYQSLIDQLDLNDVVKTELRYIPYSEVHYYFNAADVTVFPYKQFDSQSGAGNIAIGFNKPVIVSRVGGLPNLVKDDRVVFDPGDYIALSNILIDVIQNKTFQDKLIDDTKVISHSLSWNQIAEQTIELYKSIY